ncbi:unnamed protein product [Amoebophrya sp. A120]|nr:unnamed protein product [Amoebophrya sp. A120]|eukprot:GSA120T00014356001.1
MPSKKAQSGMNKAPAQAGTSSAKVPPAQAGGNKHQPAAPPARSGSAKNTSKGDATTAGRSSSKPTTTTTSNGGGGNKNTTSATSVVSTGMKKNDTVGATTTSKAANNIKSTTSTSANTKNTPGKNAGSGGSAVFVKKNNNKQQKNHGKNGNAAASASGSGTATATASANKKNQPAAGGSATAAGGAPVNTVMKAASKDKAAALGGASATAAAASAGNKNTKKNDASKNQNLPTTSTFGAASIIGPSSGVVGVPAGGPISKNNNKKIMPCKSAKAAALDTKDTLIKVPPFGAVDVMNNGKNNHNAGVQHLNKKSLSKDSATSSASGGGVAAAGAAARPAVVMKKNKTPPPQKKQQSLTGGKNASCTSVQKQTSKSSSVNKAGGGENEKRVAQEDEEMHSPSAKRAKKQQPQLLPGQEHHQQSQKNVDASKKSFLVLNADVLNGEIVPPSPHQQKLAKVLHAVNSNAENPDFGDVLEENALKPQAKLGSVGATKNNSSSTNAGLTSSAGAGVGPAASGKKKNNGKNKNSKGGNKAPAAKKNGKQLPVAGKEQLLQGAGPTLKQNQKSKKAASMNKNKKKTNNKKVTFEENSDSGNAAAKNMNKSSNADQDGAPESPSSSDENSSEDEKEVHVQDTKNAGKMSKKKTEKKPEHQTSEEDEPEVVEVEITLPENIRRHFREMRTRLIPRTPFAYQYVTDLKMGKVKPLYADPNVDYKDKAVLKCVIPAWMYEFGPEGNPNKDKEDESSDSDSDEGRMSQEVEQHYKLLIQDTSTTTAPAVVVPSTEEKANQARVAALEQQQHGENEKKAPSDSSAVILNAMEMLTGEQKQGEAAIPFVDHSTSTTPGAAVGHALLGRNASKDSNLSKTSSRPYELNEYLAQILDRTAELLQQDDDQNNAMQKENFELLVKQKLQKIFDEEMKPKFNENSKYTTVGSGENFLLRTKTLYDLLAMFPDFVMEYTFTEYNTWSNEKLRRRLPFEMKLQTAVAISVGELSRDLTKKMKEETCVLEKKVDIGSSVGSLAGQKMKNGDNAMEMDVDQEGDVKINTGTSTTENKKTTTIFNGTSSSATDEQAENMKTDTKKNSSKFKRGRGAAGAASQMLMNKIAEEGNKQLHVVPPFGANKTKHGLQLAVSHNTVAGLQQFVADPSALGVLLPKPSSAQEHHLLPGPRAGKKNYMAGSVPLSSAPGVTGTGGPVVAASTTTTTTSLKRPPPVLVPHNKGKGKGATAAAAGTVPVAGAMLPCSGTTAGGGPAQKLGPAVLEAAPAGKELVHLQGDLVEQVHDEDADADDEDELQGPSAKKMKKTRRSSNTGAATTLTKMKMKNASAGQQQHGKSTKNKRRSSVGIDVPSVMTAIEEKLHNPRLSLERDLQLNNPIRNSTDYQIDWNNLGTMRNVTKQFDSLCHNLLLSSNNSINKTSGTTAGVSSIVELVPGTTINFAHELVGFSTFLLRGQTVKKFCAESDESAVGYSVLVTHICGVPTKKTSVPMDLFNDFLPKKSQMEVPQMLENLLLRNEKHFLLLPVEAILNVIVALETAQRPENFLYSCVARLLPVRFSLDEAKREKLFKDITVDNAEFLGKLMRKFARKMHGNENVKKWFDQLQLVLPLAVYDKIDPPSSPKDLMVDEENDAGSPSVVSFDVAGGKVLGGKGEGVVEDDIFKGKNTTTTTTTTTNAMLLTTATSTAPAAEKKEAIEQATAPAPAGGQDRMALCSTGPPPGGVFDEKQEKDDVDKKPIFTSAAVAAEAEEKISTTGMKKIDEKMEDNFAEAMELKTETMMAVVEKDKIEDETVDDIKTDVKNLASAKNTFTGNKQSSDFDLIFGNYKQDDDESCFKDFDLIGNYKQDDEDDDELKHDNYKQDDEDYDFELKQDTTQLMKAVVPEGGDKFFFRNDKKEKIASSGDGHDENENKPEKICTEDEQNDDDFKFGNVEKDEKCSSNYGFVNKDKEEKQEKLKSPVHQVAGPEDVDFDEL